MGEVYRARDAKPDRDAEKFLPDALAQNAEGLARFERAAKALAALNHPNIAAIYGLEDRAIVTELVEGPSLAERLAESLAIAVQIADSLVAAHEKGAHNVSRKSSVVVRRPRRFRIRRWRGRHKETRNLDAGKSKPSDFEPGKYCLEACWRLWVRI
jgi:serine/threonine-protein kinase